MKKNYYQMDTIHSKNCMSIGLRFLLLLQILIVIYWMSYTTKQKPLHLDYFHFGKRWNTKMELCTMAGL